MKMTCILVIVMGFCFGVSEAHAASWTDSFDSYAAEAALPTTDWALERTGASQQSVSTNGYSGKGVTAWSAAAQYRVAPAGTTALYAKLKDSTDIYDTAEVGFCPNNDDDTGFDLRESSVTMNLGNANLQLFSYAADGTRTQVAIVSGLPKNADAIWFDVRLTVNSDGLTVVGSYKAATSDTWIKLGTVTKAAGFAPNYVGVSCNRAAAVAIDDVAAIVPEHPAPWSESFDSYAVGGIPTDLWALEYTGASRQSVSTPGYGGSGNAVSTWGAAAQYRMAVAADKTALYGKLKDSPDIYDTVEVGFCQNNDDDNTVLDKQKSSVTMSISNANLQLFSYAADGTRTTVATAGGLPSGASAIWYDVRLIVNGLTVSGAYKATTNATWISLGTTSMPSGWSPNFVCIDGNRMSQPGIDNVMNDIIYEGTLLIIM